MSVRAIALVPAALAGLCALLPAQSAGIDDVLVLQRAQDRVARAKLYGKLRKTRVTAALEKATPKELARYLAAASGGTTNFVATTKREIEPVSIEVRNAPLTSVLDQAQRLSEVRFVFLAGAVLLQHEDEVKEYTWLRLYDVRAATAVIPDRAGPELGFRSGEQEADFDAGEDSGAPVAGFTADKLVDLIRTHVLPESWDRDGVSLSEVRGVLWVRQTVKGHRAVEELLRQVGALPTPRVVRVKR
jgi:hypothetical protein